MKPIYSLCLYFNSIKGYGIAWRLNEAAHTQTYVFNLIVCVLSGENLVSESQSQREETDQEEVGSV